MATRWYYARDNKKKGPFSPAQLKELGARGEVRPGDMVLREGDKKWLLAASIKGLFADQRKTAKEPPPADPFQFDSAPTTTTSATVKTRTTSRAAVTIVALLLVLG